MPARKGADFLKHLKNNPVSYTHLRAHETVLDIVCRLLLEKKNKNKKKKKRIITPYQSPEQTAL